MRRHDVASNRSVSGDEISLTLPARPATVPAVRQAVQQFITRLRCTDRRSFEIQVAIGEAVTNAIIHAYPKLAGMVQVKLWRSGKTLYAEVEDQGKWATGPPKGLGVGLRVIETFADDARIKTTKSGTTIRLMFSLGPKTDSTTVGEAGAAARALG